MSDPAPQDMHVHSTFSDGAGTIEENIAAADAAGLEELGCVDHVRITTEWVPSYVEAVRSAEERSTIALQCGIEAKILDTAGTLDLPTEGIDDIDAIYAADHQVATADGPAHPRKVAEALAAGELEAADVIANIVTSTAEAVTRYDNVVIAHLFSILPKIGLDESDVPLELIESLADATRAGGARVEVSERWRCPSARTLRPFVDRGMTVLMSTDSHRPEHIGQYDYCAQVIRELGGGE
jgi:putative hydrolase